MRRGGGQKDFHFVTDLAGSRNGRHDEMFMYYSCNIARLRRQRINGIGFFVQFRTYEQGQRVRASIVGVLVFI
jgi:hypothetical protein